MLCSTDAPGIPSPGYGNLIKRGQGTLFFASNNSTPYDGTTTVEEGTLEAAATDALPGYNTSNTSHNITVYGGATLAVCVGSTGDWNSANGIDDINALLTHATFNTGSFLGIDTTDGDFSYGGNLGSACSTVGLAVLGDNTLALTAHNSYSGGTDVLAGKLEADAPTDLPGYNSPGRVAVEDGATLAILVGGNSSSGDWNSSTDHDISDLLTNATFNSGSFLGIDTSGATATGDFSYAGNIGGGASSALGLAKLGGNTLTLTGVNTYAGGTNVFAGTLQIAGSDNLLPTDGDLWIGANGIFDLNGHSQTVGALSGDAGAEVTNNSSLANSTLTVNYNGDSPTTYSGTIADGTGSHSVALAMNGSDMLVLAGTNTYSGGTNVIAGTLEAATTSALPGYNTTGSVAVQYNATLAVCVGGYGDWNSGGNDDIHQLLSSANFVAGSFLGIDTSDGDFSYGGDLGYGTAHNLPLGLVVLGGNTLTLTASSTYSGGTEVIDGTLAIGGGNNMLLPTGNLYIGDDGTLDLTGNNQTVGALNGDSGAEITDSSAYSVNASTLTVNYSGSSPTTYAGSIDDGPAGHVVALAKTGSGTLVMSGDSNSSGATDIEGGTVQLGSDDALGSGDLAVNNATLDLAGYDAYFASLAGNGTTGIVESAGGPATLGITGDGATAFFGTLQDGTATGSQLALDVDSSTGVLALDGTNTYSGGTYLDSGTLSVQSNANLGADSSYIEFDGGTLQVIGTSMQNFGNHTFNYGSFDGGLNIADSGDTFTIADAISGSGGLTKLGAGTLDLSGTDSYTGQTVVATGTLNVTGSLTASPVVELSGASYNGPGTFVATPQVGVNTSSVSTYVGSTATMTGWWQWPAGTTPSFSSSVAGSTMTVVRVNSTTGTWTWTYTPTATDPAWQTVTITAGDGTNTATTSLDLTANQVVPYNLCTSTTLSNYETTATVNGLFSDPLSNDPCTVAIDWGDGTTPTTFTVSSGSGSGQTSFTSPTHTYTASCDYTIQTTITGAQGSVSASTNATVFTLPVVSIGADTPTASEFGGQAGEIVVSREGGDIRQQTVVYLMMDSYSYSLMKAGDFVISGATDTGNGDSSGNEIFSVAIPAGSGITTLEVTPGGAGPTGGRLQTTLLLQANSGYDSTSSGYGFAQVAMSYGTASVTPSPTPSGFFDVCDPSGMPMGHTYVNVGSYLPMMVSLTPTSDGGKYWFDYDPDYFQIRTGKGGSGAVNPGPDNPVSAVGQWRRGDLLPLGHHRHQRGRRQRLAPVRDAQLYSG